MYNKKRKRQRRNIEAKKPEEKVTDTHIRSDEGWVCPLIYFFLARMEAGQRLKIEGAQEGEPTYLSAPVPSLVPAPCRLRGALRRGSEKAYIGVPVPCRKKGGLREGMRG